MDCLCCDRSGAECSYIEGEANGAPEEAVAGRSLANAVPSETTTQEAEDRKRTQHLESKQRQAQVAERRRALKQFLNKNGFAGVNEATRVRLFWTSYPLHVAVEKNNLRMVEMLLAEGADASQKNSSGLTAAQVAQRKNRKGKNATMLQLLQSAGKGADGLVAGKGADGLVAL